MTPPYTITSEILKLVSAISEKLGEANAYHLNKPSPKLRKQNKIKTIQASLSIEGNSLSVDQVTAIVENKRVIGPEKDVKEVVNAIQVYNTIGKLKVSSAKSFLEAHKILMTDLVDDAGKYRKRGVGIFNKDELAHMAPPAENVPALMNALFSYLKTDEITLIKSCVFHYEMEFIHPFMDGNGRMGRLWQTLILMKEYPVFEFLPFETLIGKNQGQYYAALAASDKTGNSTPFITFMLHIIDQSLAEFLKNKNPLKTAEDRLAYFTSVGKSPFSRKDYMAVFHDISTATASRDLKSGVDIGLFKKTGDKNKALYWIAK